MAGEAGPWALPLPLPSPGSRDSWAPIFTLGFRFLLCKMRGQVDSTTPPLQHPRALWAQHRK